MSWIKKIIGQNQKSYNLIHQHKFKSDENSNCIAISDDGKSVLCGNFAFPKEKNGCVVSLWDAQKGKIKKVFKGHSEGINSVSFSPSGKYAISGSYDRTFKIWNLDNGECAYSSKVYPGSVDQVYFLTDTMILVGCPAKLILSNLETRENIELLLWGSGCVTSISYSNMNHRILISLNVGELLSFNLANGDLKQVNARDSEWINVTWSSVRSVLLPDNNTAFTISNTGEAAFWDIDSGRNIKRIVNRSGVKRITGLSLLKNKGVCISCDIKGTAKIWDYSTFKCLSEINIGKLVTALAVSQDEMWAVSGSEKSISLWEIK